MNNIKCNMIKSETENSGSTVYIVCWFITLWSMQISCIWYIVDVPVMISKVTLSSFFPFFLFLFLSFYFFFFSRMLQGNVNLVSLWQKELHFTRFGTTLLKYTKV